MSCSTALSVVLLGLTLGLGAGCYVTNNNYNADAAQSCSSSSDSCPSQTPVCEEARKVCVQCTVANAGECKGDTPVCGDDNSCRGCSAHSECSSEACLPSGACAAEAEVAYVQANKNSPDGMCTRAAPCGTVWLGVLSGKPVVKVAPGLVKGGDTTLIERTVTIVGDAGAQLDRDGDGAIFSVQGKAGNTVAVTMSGVEITGSSMGDAIQMMTVGGSSPTLILDRVTIANNQGLGVFANGGNLQVYRSKLVDNDNGGISLTGATTFQIIGNFFYSNGASNKTVGGLNINVGANAANRLEFNTFHRNEAQDGTGSAIACIVGSFTARNNILYNNTTGSNMLQATGSCTHSYSLIAPGAMPAGTFNFADDPKFLGGGTSDLRLTEASPARGKADPASDLSGAARLDITGDVRTMPADIGADQFSK